MAPFGRVSPLRLVPWADGFNRLCWVSESSPAVEGLSSHSSRVVRRAGLCPSHFQLCRKWKSEGALRVQSAHCIRCSDADATNMSVQHAL